MWAIVIWFWVILILIFGLIKIIEDELNHENPTRKLIANIIALILLIRFLIWIW